MVDVQLNGQSLVTTSATTAPAAGTSETWTVTALGAGIPALFSGGTYALVDATSGATVNQQSEVIRVTAAAAGATSITVTRGADGTTPYAHAATSTFNIVLVSSAIQSRVVPYYAPTRLLNSFDPARSTYNVKPSNMHKIWAASTKVATNVAPMHIGFIGDSTLVGYNGATFDYKQSIPYRFGVALADRLNCPYPTTGVQTALAAQATAGDRWTLTGGFVTYTASAVQLLTGYGAGTATWVSPDPCTSIEFYVSNLSQSAQLTYQVDGGAASAAITTTGASTIQKVSITGLTNGFHTLKLTSTTGYTYILGARPLIPAVNQVHVHNLAVGGGHATTYSGAPVGLVWNDTSTIGLGNTSQLLLGASGVALDAIVICLGNNDASTGTAAATILSALVAVRNLTAWASVPVIFVHPPMVAGTSSTIFDALSSGFYNTIADTLDCAFLDWNYLVNTQTSMSGDSLIGADGNHPIFAEQNRMAHALADIFAGSIRGGRSTVWPNIAGNRLIESAGVYPVRPNWPAGQAQYSGADQPTDWMDGDSWDDLP